MERNRRIFLIVVVGIYLLALIFLYSLQEKLLFFPSKLPKDYTFQFPQKFEEINLKTKDNFELNGVLFKAKNSKGVVLFLHGNGGSIETWGLGADFYLENNYDIFYLDYRGYGKSEGSIKSEKQMIGDGQLAYDFLKKHYQENHIILSGTSMGTGIATQLAQRNNPKTLLLNAPYFSLESLIIETVKVIPYFIIRYKFKTYQYLQDVSCPIFIFHGKEDKTIPCQHSEKLKKVKPEAKLYIIENFGHNDLMSSIKFQEEMKKILE